jgi:peptidyl-prolyl cis-trans isomerase B (cyclophilin B)
MTRRRLASLVGPSGLIATVSVVAILAAGCMGGFASASGTAAAGSDAPTAAGTGACPTSQPAPLPAGQKRTLTIDTPKGTIVVGIDGSLSPIAAGNIVALAACGWYDGVVFHRVVPGFVIQGGDGQYGRVGPDGTLADPGAVGTGGPGYTIKDEPVTATYTRGVVAMARSQGPDSVGSQFFIVLDDSAAKSLAGPGYDNYQIIGRVTTGMDVVDAIAAAADAEIPSHPVVMTKVTVGP